MFFEIVCDTSVIATVLPLGEAGGVALWGVGVVLVPLGGLTNAVEDVVFQMVMALGKAVEGGDARAGGDEGEFLLG